MKTVIYRVLIFFALTSVSCQTKYIEVDETEIDRETLELARNLSNKILTEQRNGGFYSLNEKEATTQMINGLSESVQKESYKTIKNLFGDYEGLKFESLMVGTDEKNYMIYRFMGDFESNAAIEIRTVLDAENKLAGFFIKPWSDKL
ncbi:hypothetical protein [Allomuricauda sp. d1]|uniref:hypothetical protein n=1 Tax=Allomuricauda sp. d1 TaxID=3136725 RepID=UPI0031D0B5DA